MVKLAQVASRFRYYKNNSRTAKVSKRLLRVLQTPCIEYVYPGEPGYEKASKTRRVYKKIYEIRRHTEEFQTCMKYNLIGKNHVKRCAKYSYLTAGELRSKRCSKYANTNIFDHLVSHGKPVVYKKYVNKGTVYRAYKPSKTVKKAIKRPRRPVRKIKKPVRKPIRRPVRKYKRPVRKTIRRPTRRPVRKVYRKRPVYYRRNIRKSTRRPVRRSTSRRYVRAKPRRIVSRARRLQTTTTTTSSTTLVSNKSYTSNHTRR